MSDIGSNPDFRIVPRPDGGVPAARSGDRTPEVRPELPRSGGRRDPFDLAGAVQRLRTLLAFDGENGPRTGVPLRGFYLNILV